MWTDQVPRNNITAENGILAPLSICCSCRSCPKEKEGGIVMRQDGSCEAASLSPPRKESWSDMQAALFWKRFSSVSRAITTVEGGRSLEITCSSFPQLSYIKLRANRFIESTCLVASWKRVVEAHTCLCQITVEVIVKMISKLRPRKTQSMSGISIFGLLRLVSLEQLHWFCWST